MPLVERSGAKDLDRDHAAPTPKGVLQPERAAAHFALERRVPARDLAPYVDRHWLVRWDLGEGGSFTQEILPHPCVNIVSEPGLTAVWGIPTERSPHRIEGAGIAIGTKFLPGAFCALAGVAAGEVNGRHLPLAEVLGTAGELQSELEAAAGDPSRHIGAMEAAIRRLPPPDSRLELVRAATRTLLEASPGISVAEVAAGLSVSERTLQRAFHALVGVGPKWVGRRYRMHEAAERIASGETGDLASLAHELGYFDQAHFTSDFSRQIDSPPARYLRTSRWPRAGPPECTGRAVTSAAPDVPTVAARCWPTATFLRAMPPRRGHGRRRRGGRRSPPASRPYAALSPHSRPEPEPEPPPGAVGAAGSTLIPAAQHPHSSRSRRCSSNPIQPLPTRQLAASAGRSMYLDGYVPNLIRSTSWTRFCRRWPTIAGGRCWRP